MSASDEIDAIIAGQMDWRGSTLAQLRAVIRATDPAIVEVIKWRKPSRPEGAPGWSLAGIVCIGEFLKNAVRLSFPKGAYLEDPKKLFNTRLTSASVRGIDV